MIIFGLLCVFVILGFGKTAFALRLNASDLLADDLPKLDLNGPNKQGTGYSATFAENEGPVTIVGQELELTSGNTNINSATITLQSFPDQSNERLSVDVDGTPIQSTYNSATGILNLVNVASVETYKSVLKTVTYLNEAQAPTTNTDRVITFIVNDGLNNSDEVSSIVAILATNDAPILDNSGDMRLDPIAEDDQTQIGNRVSTIIASAEQSREDRITDPDYPEGIGPEGMGVIEVGDSNGTWEYSIDSGSTWAAFGTVNNSSAVLLDETSRIRFLPDANYNGIASFIFRAWDQSTTQKAGERADASINGGTSAFSEATESVTIDVTPVNDPPVIDLNGQLPGEEFVASFLSHNQAVPLTTSDAFVFDVESTELFSMTVTLKNRPDNLEEYLTVQARQGIASSYDPDTGILLLTGTASLADYSTTLRSLKYINEAETMTTDPRTIEFVANDKTDDSLPRTTTLVSFLSNVAPVLDPDAAMHFSPVNEDDEDPVGDNVGELLATAVADPIHDDDQGALRGFAIVGSENKNGVWQFSVDDGTSWIAFGNVSNQAAVLLNEQARIRFLPEPDFSGETRKITIRAWDQTEGANGLSGVDATQNGGITSFSASTSSIPVMITPLNDAPVLTITENTIAQFIEGNGPVIVAGPAIQIIDVDGDMLQSATIKIDNLIANQPDVLDVATNGSGITADYVAETGILTLTGKATLTDYQSVLRLVTFDNLSQDPSVDDRFISFVVFDGVDSSNDVSSIVSVESINDPPLLDLNGDDSPGKNNTVYYNNDGIPGGGSISLASAMQIFDADNTTLIGAKVRMENRPDGLSESLTIDTLDTNISVDYQDNGRQIILSGQDSLAAYQRVLRKVVYANTLSRPNRAIREISFTIQDALLGQSTSIANVVVQPQLVFLPLFANYVSGPLIEEPNDSCEEAVPISTNYTYEFMADDVNDWFSFTLPNAAEITVELTEFQPIYGQILVADGVCGSLKRIGHNGDNSAAKTIKLGSLKPGRYYIWLITDELNNNQDPYKLRVVAN
jgi:hypothetical protein